MLMHLHANSFLITIINELLYINFNFHHYAGLMTRSRLMDNNTPNYCITETVPYSNRIELYKK